MCVLKVILFFTLYFFSLFMCVCVEGLYERRRSLRVKGLEPEEKGFDWGPFCITSCVDGFIHVCDCVNGRVQIF